MSDSGSSAVLFCEPDPVLTARPSLRKYLRYLLFFGPGAVLASMTIGQGQLILGPQIGAWAGYALLWLITLNIGSYLICYVGTRFTMLSGISVMDVFALKTRRGWINWLLIGIMAIFVPTFAATIITTLGKSLEWIFGGGHYLFWGISFSVLAALLALLGRYKLLEVSQAFFVAVLGVGAIASVALLRPDLLDLLPNFFRIGNVPSYPGWVDTVPDFTKTPIPLSMMGYLGTLTISIVPLVGYLGWVKVKKWGIFRGSEDPAALSQRLFSRYKEKGAIDYLPEDRQQLRMSRLHLRPLMVDLAIAFLIVSLVSAAYMIAGADRLGRDIPTDVELIKRQAVIFSDMASWLKPLYQVSVAFALFGTVYSAFEAATRMLYETTRTIRPTAGRLSYKRFMLYFLVYVLSLGIPLALLMASGLSVLLVLSITLLFIGVIGVIIYGVGAVYITQRVLPAAYRLHPLSLAAAVVGVLLLCIPLLYLFL
ncbi:MAG: Nramp family divalent metal transporter [Candidatus Thermoplasmatota archaeon]|nr:Nramp family divalent metal transporter [Candidatus Thermoplasmatota archaeon]